jgi:hypothetical protein
MTWRSNGGNARRHRDMDSAGMCWKKLFFRDWNSASIRLQKRGSKFDESTAMAQVGLVGAAAGTGVAGQPGWHWQRSRNMPAPAVGMVLLLPDNAPSQKYVLAWQDAAAESGVLMSQMRASDFVALDASQRAQIRGVVLPDSIHRYISPALVVCWKNTCGRAVRCGSTTTPLPKMPKAVFWSAPS